MGRHPIRFEHDGVEGLRTGRFDLGISSTCILYRLGSTLVDTGPPNQWHAVRRFIRERDVRRVLVTHHHEDHSGNAARLVRETGAGVFMHEDGVERMRTGFRLRPYQHVIWGRPGRLRPRANTAETELDDGIRLRALHAPGHSPDMTCYLEPERGWLFTGDLYIASRPRFMRVDENVDDQIASLRGLLDLDFGVVFCAHRGVVVDGPAALRAKLDYLVALREEVRERRARGHSISEITDALLGRENFMSFITLFHFSKRNLIRGCLEEPR